MVGAKGSRWEISPALVVYREGLSQGALERWVGSNCGVLDPRLKTVSLGQPALAGRTGDAGQLGLGKKYVRHSVAVG
jgi:hypothetical protein